MGQLAVISTEIDGVEKDLYPVSIPEGIIDPSDKKALSEDLPKIKDKTYDSAGYSGLGRTYLKKNMVDGVNLLTQAMISFPDTVYIIEWDFDLNGETLEVPADCVLDFKGGQLSNGILKGNNTSIDSGLSKIFDTNLSLSGTYNIQEWCPEWFGAVGGNEEIKSTVSIQSAINAANSTNNKNVCLTNNHYYIDDTLEIYSFINFYGKSNSGKWYASHNIHQTVNKDAIHVSKGAAAYIRQVYLSNFSVTNDYEESDMSNNGIYLFSDTEDTQCMHLRIINVFVTYFNKGFLYDGYGENGFAYNEFLNFHSTYNKIGLHLKGSLSSDTSITRKPWCNHNKFEECVINSNYIGGILIEGFRSNQEVLFFHSAIEGNGLNYKYEDYVSVGRAGFAFYGKGAGFGVVRFDCCYIENNYPRRKVSEGAADASGEYTYNNYVYPVDYHKNACFICSLMFIEVSRCMLSKYILLCHSRKTIGIHFHDNEYDLSKIAYKADAEKDINYFFSFNEMNGNEAYSYIYIDEKFPKGYYTNNLLSEIDSVYKLDSASDVYNFRNADIYIKHPLADSVTEINSIKGTLRNGTLYLSNSGGNGLGLNPNNPLSMWSAIDQISHLYFEEDATIYVKLINDYNLETNYEHASMYNRHPLYVYAKSGVTWTLTKYKTFYNSVTFKGLTINLEGTDYSQYFRPKGDTIIFDGCTFNFKDVNRYLIYASKQCHILFNNCTFNVLDTSTGTTLYVQNGTKANTNMLYNNCTIQEGITLRSNGYYLDHSNLSNVSKAVGDVMMVDNSIYCEYDGEDTINPDGTLFGNVVRVKTLSQLSTGSAGKRYKIVKDIDLNDATLTIPYGSIIEFEGGKITNGTVDVNYSMFMPLGLTTSKYITATITGYYAEGQVVYDDSLKKQKLWNGFEWVNLDGTTI